MRKYFEYLNFEELEDEEKAREMIDSLAGTLKREVMIDLYGGILRRKKIFNLNFST